MHVVCPGNRGRGQDRLQGEGRPDRPGSRDSPPSCVAEAKSTTREKVRIRITGWFARRKGCPRVLEGVKVAETEEALLLDEANLGELWIPKSQIEREAEP